jgi:hypothetical protein
MELITQDMHKKQTEVHEALLKKHQGTDKTVVTEWDLDSMYTSKPRLHAYVKQPRSPHDLAFPTIPEADADQSTAA